MKFKAFIEEYFEDRTKLTETYEELKYNLHCWCEGQTRLLAGTTRSNNPGSSVQPPEEFKVKVAASAEVKKFHNTCFYCLKKGHRASDCKIWAKDRKQGVYKKCVSEQFEEKKHRRPWCSNPLILMTTIALKPIVKC